MQNHTKHTAKHKPGNSSGFGKLSKAVKAAAVAHMKNASRLPMFDNKEAWEDLYRLFHQLDDANNFAESVSKEQDAILAANAAGDNTEAPLNMYASNPWRNYLSIAGNCCALMTSLVSSSAKCAVENPVDFNISYDTDHQQKLKHLVKALAAYRAFEKHALAALKHDFRFPQSSITTDTTIDSTDTTPTDI